MNKKLTKKSKYTSKDWEEIIQHGQEHLYSDEGIGDNYEYLSGNQFLELVRVITKAKEASDPDEAGNPNQ